MTDEDLERRQRRYQMAADDALLAAELEVLGSDYRANGYTTRAQADLLGALLELRPHHTLLDLGAGCGWPGLYLAHQHGCAVISVDPVLAGGVTARRRAVVDGLAKRAWPVTGDATAIPLRNGSVDAIVHTDVMC